MIIENVDVYGLEKSIIASGYPMALDIHDPKLKDMVNARKRAANLAESASGSGHDNFLKGIIVQFDIIAPSYWWPQFQRYHFMDIVSSQSKMHCLSRFDVKRMCNKYVDPEITQILERHIAEFKADKSPLNFMKMISNVPMGFQLGARVTLSYLQLKTIYAQRKNHKLKDWKDFCSWVESLPESIFIISRV